MLRPSLSSEARELNRIEVGDVRRLRDRPGPQGGIPSYSAQEGAPQGNRQGNIIPVKGPT